ncbi:PREDICTED: uncharacterized protein LOC109465672 isoform X1 [Branchiostoma belcheri]|uniref:Uncharacterized protein LOC109465672 isoform X1 n=1 Tax=Branchiostoma belcheri TaxID=7741 RepID=A0A6P4YIT7_BRABE|nr:PREDICTED: uncharacterized protein LOC109465672 isoform X1 [Branchiostoma belcheri]
MGNLLIPPNKEDTVTAKQTKVADELPSASTSTTIPDSPDDKTTDSTAAGRDTSDLQEEGVTVNEINKRVLGKLIVEKVGNEGADVTARAAVLRTALQRAITHLESQPAEVWQNAELEIIDKYGQVYHIRAGQAENKFVLYHDGTDNIKFTCREKATWKWPWQWGSFQEKPKALEDKSSL